MIQRLLLLLIRYYQRAISPGLPAACRYQPTCSHYAYEAIERFGAVHGGWLTLRRLCRCVPWRPGGYDPVPDRVDQDVEHDALDASSLASISPVSAPSAPVSPVSIPDRRQAVFEEHQHL